MTGPQGTCYGCGAALQTEQEDAAGYVAPEKYELKRAHRQLNQLVCRCEVKQIACGMASVHMLQAALSHVACFKQPVSKDVHAPWHAGILRSARS